MKRTQLLLLILLGLTACDNPIKDNTQVQIEPGTDTTALPTKPKATTPTQPSQIIGNWVGYFLPAERIVADYVSADTWNWTRENKINIAIDAVRGDSVYGHSVVAGNDRPFVGTRSGETDNYTYEVREPGDDRYDGVFKFQLKDGQLEGTWSAYGDIEIKERKYTLEPATFVYDPKVSLEEVSIYVDWTKTRQAMQKEEIDGVIDEWMQEEFASAGNEIYELNASSQRLTKTQVENLKRGELTIIRNTIYARHGYSFKQRPLRVFFDAQPWYIPVHADIRADFTDLEKDNIKLLLRYEKNAAEYYDTFGRG